MPEKSVRTRRQVEGDAGAWARSELDEVTSEHVVKRVFEVVEVP